MKRILLALSLGLAGAGSLLAADAVDLDGKSYILENKIRGNAAIKATDQNIMAQTTDYYCKDCVWTFEKAGTGTYYIKSALTGQYVGAVPSQVRVHFPLVDSKSQATAYTVDFSIADGYVSMYDATLSTEHNAMHMDDSNRVVIWTKDSDGSLYNLIEADSFLESLDSYYTIHNYNGSYVSTNSMYSDSNGLKLTNATEPTTMEGYWHIFRNSDGYYRFVNAGNPGKLLGSTGSEASARTKLVTPAGATATVDFDGTLHFDGTSKSYIKLAGSANNYWNKRGDYLALWNTSDAVGDNGSTFYISAVDPADETRFTEYAKVNGGSRPEGVSDWTLWYNVPVAHSGASDTWMEYALPLGNGQLGATIRGGIFKDELQFNEKTLWAGTTANSNQGYYQNFGSILVTDKSQAFSLKDESVPVNDYTRHLDIESGTAGVDYSGASTNYQRRYFVSATDGVLVARYEADGTEKLNLTFAYQPDNRINATGLTYSDNSATFRGKLDIVSYNTQFKVVASPGATVKATDAGIAVTDANWAMLVMAAKTDYDVTKSGAVSGQSANDLATEVAGRVDAAIERGYDSLLADHVAKFSSYMKRVNLQLGEVSDKTTEDLIKYYATDANKTTPEGLYLESLYFQYGRYFTVAANLDSSIHAPANLQGIWNDRSNTSFWHCDIHADINVQMNYWPADPTNLSEMHLPFLEHIIDLASAANSPWKSLANKLKSGARGWTVAVENNIFGGTSTWKNTTIKSLGAWYATHLWRYYKYTLDRDFLKRALPVMFDAACFIKDISSEDSDGKWVVTGEWSPEHGAYNQITAFTQQNGAEVLANVIAAHAELADESPLTASQIKEITDFYEVFDKGLWTETYNGVDNISEWKRTALTDQGHRHLSHLMCLFPYSQVSPWNETAEGQKLFKAAHNGQIARNGDVTGWSMGWQTNTYARCLDGDRARANLSKALRHSTSYVIAMGGQGGCYYNLFDAHSPFQIDGNFGCTSGIAEMLMQSYDDVITVLPALPTAWAKGSVTGLKAQGDYTVDITWDENKAKTMTITNNRNEAREAAIRIDGKVFNPVMAPYQVLTIDCENPNFEESVIISEVADPDNAAHGVYDLQGRRVLSPAHGLYIVDGHKRVL